MRWRWAGACDDVCVSAVLCMRCGARGQGGPGGARGGGRGLTPDAGQTKKKARMNAPAKLAPAAKAGVQCSAHTRMRVAI